MRKVFVVLLALSLGSLIVSCSEDDTTVTPVVEFGITTTALDPGYTCTPYGINLEAEGGTAPYTWSLAVGSTLPAGVELSADGRITGMLDAAGTHTFSVVCTDAADTPHTDEVEFTLDVAVPSNPSLAIFFDGEATQCDAQTLAFTALDCHVFIMLEASDYDCASAAEFMITMSDQDGNPLEIGTQYAHSYVSFPDHVAVTMGDPFSGIAIAFERDMYEPYVGPIGVASFGLLLLENLNNLSFNIVPSPGSGTTRPIIAGCDVAKSTIEVDGRAAAVNYPVVD